MKKLNLVFYFFSIAFLLITTAILIFLIYFKITYKNHTSINTSFLQQDISLKPINQIYGEIQKIFWGKIPENFVIYIDDKKYTVISKKIISSFWIDTQDLIESTVNKDINLMDKKELSPKITYNYSAITKLFDYKIQEFENTDVIKIENNQLINCEKKTIKATINYQKLENLLYGMIFNNQELKLKIQDILKDPIESKFIEDCNEYWNNYQYLKNYFESVYTKLNFDDYFSIVYINGKPKWNLIKENELKSKINEEYAIHINKDLIEGEYEIVKDKIYLYKQYQKGKLFNTHLTINKIQNWIWQKSGNIDPVIEEFTPQVLKYNLQILDFTKKLAEGKTRLHRVLNNAGNEIFFAEQGMYEIDKIVVMPKEIFSYIDTIQPTTNGFTKNGRMIGSGICNATTTLFRAVLESGFPIIDRSPHGRNYQSYSWGYPLNIVDAAYYTNPKVDLKFQNDLDYPVLFRIEIRRDNEYQYHTIYVYTSSLAPNRRVNLTNWQKFNVYSDKVFSGSFDRKVYQNDLLIREDTFISRYY